MIYVWKKNNACPASVLAAGGSGFREGTLMRVDKQNYYLDIAETVLERGTCLRRNYGAIIVQNDEIVSTGYSGAPRGRKNCLNLNFCAREQLKIPQGQRYELCRSVHAEANAIISAPRQEMLGATLYLAGRDMKTGQILENPESCAMCRRLIINAGIATVVTRSSGGRYTVTDVSDWITNDDSLPPMPEPSGGGGQE